MGMEEALPLLFVQKVPDGKEASLASLTMQGLQAGTGCWAHLQAVVSGAAGEVVTQWEVCPGFFEYRECTVKALPGGQVNQGEEEVGTKSRPCRWRWEEPS